MKIELKQTSAGPKGVLPAGTIVDVDEATGKYLIDSRQGVEVKAPFPVPVSEIKAEIVETATAPDVPETGDWPKRRRGRPPAKENETPQEG